MSSKLFQIPSTQTLVTAAASATATVMLLRSVARELRSIGKELIPRELRGYMFSKLTNYLASFSSQLTLIIEEFEGLTQNQLFTAAHIYLATIIYSDTNRLKVNLPPQETQISISMETNQETIDIFNGISFKWEMISKKTSPKHISDTDKSSTAAGVSKLRYFELTFHKKHKQIAIDTYLPHLLSKSKEAREETKTLKLFTLAIDGRKPWQSVKLDHPATFDTLAMDSELKNRIINDLDRFAKRKGFYKRVGKAWKRGYLLFGPPGTGKSSLIAAMANYLKFDIYDLELTDIRNNSQLRRLLISTGNKSILVVEDIDCSIELQNRSKTAKSLNPLQSDRGYQVNLSGFLNFIDGLWSSCGDERVIVFTTNHKDRLDPALLRPGRMDMHIHMSYCTPCGFKMLASNYFGIEEHPLFVEIEQLISITKVTPAEIGEQLMKEEEAEIAFRGVVDFLQGKKKESDEIKTSEETEEEKIES